MPEGQDRMPVKGRTIERRMSVGMGREGGKLLLQMAALPAGGAQRLVHAGTAHQFSAMLG